MLDAEKLEVQSDSLEEIARTSALDAVRRLRVAIVVEDAGLFVDALHGFPGPYSSYALRTIALRGILRLMEGVRNRRAVFKSVVAYADPTGNVRTFPGTVAGMISDEPRGTHGFGFDPIFIPDGRRRTFAEMTIDEKNEISHRAEAFKALARWLLSSGP